MQIPIAVLVLVYVAAALPALLLVLPGGWLVWQVVKSPPAS